MSGESLGELFVNLSLKADDFNEGISTAGDKVKSFGKSLTSTGKTLTTFGTGAIVGAGAGLLALAKSAGNTADRLLDLEQVTGLNTDALQEWQYVSKAAGVDFEGFIGTISKFESKLPTIQSGTSEASKAFQTLGVNLYDSQGNIRDMNALFPEMITAMQGIENPVERNALATQLFGRDLDNLAPVLGLTTEQLAAYKKEAHAAGAVVSNDSLNSANQFRESMDKLQGSLSGLALGLGAAFAPLLSEFVPVINDSILPAIQSFAPVIKSMAEGFAALPGPVKSGIVVFAALVAAIGPVLLVLGPLITGIGTILPLIAGAGGLTGVVTAAGAVITGTLLPAIGAVLPILLPVIVAVGALYLAFKYWDDIAAIVYNAFNTVKDILTNIDYVGEGTRIVTTLVNGIGASIFMPHKMFMNSISMVFEALTGVSLYSAGSNLMGTFVKGIKSSIRDAYNAVLDGLASIDRLMPHSPAKEGPFSTLPNWNAVFEGMEDVDTKGMASKAIQPINDAIINRQSTTQTYSDSMSIGPNTFNNGTDIDDLIERINRLNSQKRIQRGVA